MKKLLSVLLAVVMICMLLAACGSEGDTTTSEPPR